MTDPALPVVVVRGCGDVGSAVAHRLFTAGFPVVLHDDPLPAAPRRGMAFADAFFDGECLLAGLIARRFDRLAELEKALADRSALAVTSAGFFDVITHAAPAVLVDGRMRKRSVPEIQTGLAELTVGLGPNFRAGEHTHWVVETQWGDHLGEILKSGETRQLAGEPRSFDGHARERFVYAQLEGVFRTTRRIGDRVQKAEVVAQIGPQALAAPLAGILRGLVRDAVPVKPGAKVVEVDPRGDSSSAFGIGERPGRIGESVCAAVLEWSL
ncbi:MAG: hypothetical protein ACT4OM_01920 [Actinomycetota bacterium]